MLSQDKGRAGMSRRLREIREEMFGKDDVVPLAEALHVPCGTWKNYEAGERIPAAVLLRFIDTSGASALWLLTGKGHRFLDRARPDVPALSAAVRGRS